MREIHAPHEAIHTWKDFFIHIATIVIGLLIAIGLEQTVEYIHHHQQAKHAREMLQQEMERNRKFLETNIFTTQMSLKHHTEDIEILQRLRKHALTPGDRLITIHPYETFADASWQTVHESGAAAFLPPEELESYASLYRTTDQFVVEVVESNRDLGRVATVLGGEEIAPDRLTAERGRLTIDADGQSGEAAAELAYFRLGHGPEDLTPLTPAQIDRLELALQAAIYDDQRLLTRCRTIKHGYDAFTRKP
jgi:hypothetical protein